MMKKLLVLGTLGAVAIALAYASYKTTRWGGSYGYTRLEYELTFQDSRGNPVEGVVLRVEDPRGEEFFCFPVTDYAPGHTPKSDKDGVLRFHHVDTGVEWDNYGWILFWFFYIQTTKSPTYVCCFLHDGTEVHRVLYHELPHWDWPGQMWEQVPKVKRRWNWSTVIPEEIRYKADDTPETHDARLRQFFHDDGGDRANREVSVAFRNADRLLYHLEEPRLTHQEPVEDIEFPVIRRTITVTVPGAGR